MKKAIILLNGTPEGKNSFNFVLKEIAWVWSINPKAYVADKAKLFHYDGVGDIEEYVGEHLKLVNSKFDFEKKYLSDNISRFNADDDEVKTHGNKSFDTFVLVAHGVSRDVVEYLKSEFGVFTIHISRRDLKTNIERYDTVLYYDDEDFSIQVNRAIHVLTSEGE